MKLMTIGVLVALSVSACSTAPDSRRPVDTSHLSQDDAACILANECRKATPDEVAAIQARRQEEELTRQLIARLDAAAESERKEQAKRETEQPTIKKEQQPIPVVSVPGIPYVPGAVVCRDHSTVDFMITWYQDHFEDSLQDAVTGGQSRLIRGAPTSEPPLERFGCILVPAGTPMTLERGNVVPVVSATLANGKTVRGITNHYLMRERCPNRGILGFPECVDEQLRLIR